MGKLLKHYREIVDRIKSATPDFDENRFHILIVDENNFDGTIIQSCTLSKDMKWVCIPRKVEDQQGEHYLPVCYEVVQGFETFVRNDSMNWRVRVLLLNKR